MKALFSLFLWMSLACGGVVSWARLSAPTDDLLQRTVADGVRRLAVSHDPCEREKEYQVAGGDQVVIWGIDAKGYSVRAVSHKDYLDYNLNYLVKNWGWQTASGGGITVTGK